MGGAGGTPDLKDPAGIGGSRSTLEGKMGGVPEWAAGDTMGSWLTKAFPGVQMNAQNVSEATTGNTGTVSAPEPTTMASLGFPAAGNRPPEYAAGTGNRTETITRQAEQPMRPTAPIAAAAPPPAAASTTPTTKPDDWVSVGMPAGFNTDVNNLYRAQQQPGVYNYNGVYMPKDISQINAWKYSTAQGTGQPLTGADAENQPRMRRQLYEFNMNAYGNPYGPQGAGSGPAWWEGQPSWLMGSTGGG